MGINIQENIQLAPYTTLKVGGPARFFVETKNEEEILEAAGFAQEKNLPVFVLGGGSNVLVSDKGFDGLVLKILNTKYQILDTKIDCGAGCQLSKIVNESAKAGLTGLEWAAGIPGTVGGAIRGNAGAFGGNVADCIESVKVLEIPGFAKARLFPSDKQIVGIPQSQALKSQLRTLPTGRQVTNYQLRDCKFSYRSSIFKENTNLIILSAVFQLKKGDSAESEKKVKEIIKQRKEAQPFDFPSSGSFFKNPCLAGRQAVARKESIIQEYEKETGNKAKDNIIPAGYLIDLLNLRGKKIGGAMVSQEHGNFLVNAGNATAEDFIILMSLIKQKARVHFGIQLQEEVQLVGF